MAVNKPSGSRRRAQLNPEGTLPGTTHPFSGQLHLYETISSLNLGFEQVLENLAYLKELNLFRGKFPNYFVKIFSFTMEEMRAWANFELSEVLGEHAETVWAHFGRLRHHWEKKLQDPNDVLIEAERLKQKLRKAADRKATEKKRRKKNIRERAE